MDELLNHMAKDIYPLKNVRAFFGNNRDFKGTVIHSYVMATQGHFPWGGSRRDIHILKQALHFVMFVRRKSWMERTNISALMSITGRQLLVNTTIPT
jgi:hypothetical protein